MLAPTLHSRAWLLPLQPSLPQVLHFCVPQVVTAEGCYSGGRVTVVALPEELLGPDNRHTWPLRRVEGKVGDAELREHEARELAKVRCVLGRAVLGARRAGGALCCGAMCWGRDVMGHALFCAVCCVLCLHACAGPVWLATRSATDVPCQHACAARN